MNNRKSMHYIAFIITLFVLIPRVESQERVMNAYDVFNLKTVLDARMSPGGDYIAYTLSSPRPFSDGDGSNYTHLYVYNIKSSSSKAYMQGKNSVSSIDWTPDGRRMTFMGRFDGEKKTRVYAMDIDGGGAYALADLPYSVSGYSLSPNGNELAFLSTGKSDPSEFVSFGFKQEVYEEEGSHINMYLYDLSTKALTQLTHDVTVRDMMWSPDGQSIAAQVTSKNLIDYNYMFRELVLINPKTADSKLLVEKHGKMGDMAFSPDGKYIVFVSGTSINDPVAGSVYVVPAGGAIQKFSELKNLVNGMEISVTRVNWLDRQTIVFSADQGCQTILHAMNFEGGKHQQLIEGGKSVFSNFDVNGSRIVIVGNSAKHPNELNIFNRDEKSFVTLTDHNPWLSDIKMGRQEIVRYKARDGLMIEGVLIYPADYQSSVLYPCIALIHGGPEANMEDGWQTSYSRWGQVAAARGYFVFMPNYRASSGRGVKFSMMNYGKLGEEEFDDVLDGIDFLSNEKLIDKSKVGIGGGSYGGYFAALGATKHSTHFAASVVSCGVSNQISKRNSTDIPWEDYHVHWGFWTSENFEKVYKASPVAYATMNNTPTLILHGTADPRVSPSQSLELYRVLKMEGKAPVRLIWYPGEGHGNRNNPARLDYLLRTMAWFDYYLKGEGPVNEMPPKDILYDIKSR